MRVGGAGSVRGGDKPSHSVSSQGNSLQRLASVGPDMFACQVNKWPKSVKKNCFDPYRSNKWAPKCHFKNSTFKLRSLCVFVFQESGYTGFRDGNYRLSACPGQVYSGGQVNILDHRCFSHGKAKILEFHSLPAQDRQK